MTTTDINQIKTVIRHSIALNVTQTVAQTLFNKHFEEFDLEFIDEYFTLYKKSYLKAAYYSNFTKTDGMKRKFVEYLVSKGKEINAEGKFWFTIPYLRFQVIHFKDVIISIRNAFKDEPLFAEFEKLILTNVSLYVKNNDNTFENRHKLIQNAHLLLLTVPDFGDETSQENIQSSIQDLMNDRPLETLNTAAFKGLKPNDKQIEILEKDDEFFKEHAFLKVKAVSAGNWVFYDEQIFIKYPQYKHLISFEVRNHLGAITADDVDSKIKDIYFVQKTKLSLAKAKIQSGISSYEISRYMNTILSQLNPNSLFKLLQHVNISRMSQNTEFLSELVEYIDVYGNISDDNIELLILSYKI